METSARLDKFKIVIVGKANVGKSTLFNRLVGRREAIVFDRPGVTRDLRDREIVFMGKQACIVDTPGLLDTLSFKDHPDLRRIIASELGNAIQEASLLLFLLDGASGITVIDRDVAELIRKSGKQVMVLVNKSDRSEADSVYDEALEFGFERTMKISAEHGTHIDELLESIHGLLPVASETDDSATPAPDETAIKLAIVGRPNVGKSAMVNSIIGSYKRCVGDYAGLTRESASLEFNFRGQQVVIIDTPGLRRKSRITDTLEMITTSNCRNAYKSADVVILVIDASSLICGEIESYDLKIAADVVKEGKAIIIAFNKCDLTPFDFNDTPEFLKRNFMMSFSQLKEVPYLFVSALLNKNIDRLMKLMLSSYHKRCRKIKTSDLNSWLHSIRDAGVLQSGGSRFSLKYITQVRASPPTFLIFVSNSENMRNDQKRFVINNLKNHFEMGDVVTRIIFKNQKRVSGR